MTQIPTPIPRTELRQIRRAVGLQIQAARFKRQMYLQELSLATGLSQRLLANYEMCKDIITLDALYKIAAALRISLPQLVVPIKTS